MGMVLNGVLSVVWSLALGTGLDTTGEIGKRCGMPPWNDRRLPKPLK